MPLARRFRRERLDTPKPGECKAACGSGRGQSPAAELHGPARPPAGSGSAVSRKGRSRRDQREELARIDGPADPGQRHAAHVAPRASRPGGSAGWSWRSAPSGSGSRSTGPGTRMANPGPPSARPARRTGPASRYRQRSGPGVSTRTSPRRRTSRPVTPCRRRPVLR